MSAKSETASPQSALVPAFGLVVFIALGLGSFYALSRIDGTGPGRLKEPPAATKPAPELDPLVALNQGFRAAYQDARNETLAKSGPIVILTGDELVLIHQGKREQARVIPGRYHALKTIAHVPLPLYVMFVPFGDGPVSAERLKKLEDFRQLILAAQASLDSQGFKSEQLVRQQRIIAESLNLIDQMKSKPEVLTADVKAFAKRLSPLVMANVNEAVQAEIDGLHAQMLKWQAKLSKDDWNALRAIIIAPQMPRVENLGTQYFAWLLEVKGEGPRIIYAESLFEEPRALNLLATHQIDTAIGADFFGDDRRMHRDLLADATKAYLPTLKRGDP
jgi:hypothetical protein